MSESADAIKAVLGELLNNADPASQRVLRSYNPNAQYQTNLTNILKCDAKELEPCATYLGFTVRTDENVKLYKNQKILGDRIILKIEALFDTQCDECDESYKNELSETPLLACQICMQGCHNCENMQKKIKAYSTLCTENLKPAGLTWLCHGCLKKNNLDLVPPTKAIKGDAKPDNPNQVENGQLSSIEEENADKKEEEDEEGNRVSPRRDRYKGSSNTEICEAYKKRKCPHGLTGKRLIDGVRCPKNHPPRCHRFCQNGDKSKFGCKRGTECHYFHPQLCPESVSKRTCTNRDCILVHLKFTRRTRNPLGQQESTAGPSYQAPDPRAPGYRRSSMAPPQRGRTNSTASMYTPYPPTVDIKQNVRVRTESSSSRDDSFLEKLMENLKEGIISQMDVRLTELRTQIPSILMESDQWNNTMSQLKSSKQQHNPGCLYQQLTQQHAQLPVHHQSQMQMPTQSQMMQMPPNNVPTAYPGLFY